MDKVNRARPIRILIVDDHPIFRDGLRRLLESDTAFEVVGEGKDGQEAVDLAKQLQPDILLLDVNMPRLTGLAALPDLQQASGTMRTILLTASIAKVDIAMALQLGARGVVLKEAATQVLFTSIRAVMDGQYWVGSEGVAGLVETLKTMMIGGETEGKQTFGLTKRELEVVGAIVTGCSNKDAARKFKITEDTVKHHLSNIFDKVGVSNRLELALFAVHHKLVDEM